MITIAVVALITVVICNAIWARLYLDLIDKYRNHVSEMATRIQHPKLVNPRVMLNGEDKPQPDSVPFRETKDIEPEVTERFHLDEELTKVGTVDEFEAPDA